MAVEKNNWRKTRSASPTLSEQNTSISILLFLANQLTHINLSRLYKTRYGRCYKLLEKERCIYAYKFRIELGKQNIFRIIDFKINEFYKVQEKVPMGPTMKDVNGVSIIGKASKSRDEGMYLKKEKIKQILPFNPDCVLPH